MKNLKGGELTNLTNLTQVRKKKKNRVRQGQACHGPVLLALHRLAKGAQSVRLPGIVEPPVSGGTGAHTRANVERKRHLILLCMSATSV